MRRVLVSAIALGALSVVPLGVRAEASRGFRVVKVDANSTVTGAPSYGTPACDAAGNCLVGYSINGQLSGGMQGTFVNDGTIYSESGSSAFQVTIIGLFTGSVEGCGTGSLAFYYPLTAGSETAAFSGRFKVVPGSGTGDLAGASGSGTYTFDPQSPTGASTSTTRLLCRAG